MSLRKLGIRVGPFFGLSIILFLGWVAVSGAMMSLEPLPPMTAAPQTGTAAIPVHPRLVFVLSTGLEDVHKMNASLKGAITAKQTRLLEDVVWLACGRGVEALASIGARPAETSNLLHQAQTAGVRILVCQGGLEARGLSSGQLDPQPDRTVPNGIVTLSGLLAQGYNAVQF